METANTDRDLLEFSFDLNEISADVDFLARRLRDADEHGALRNIILRRHLPNLCALQAAITALVAEAEATTQPARALKVIRGGVAR